MKAALIGSGPGLLSAAGRPRRLCPDLDRPVKPAAVSGTSTAAEASERTGAGDYQARVIEDVANGRPVVRIACPGPAEAIGHGDVVALVEALADAAGGAPGTVTPWCSDAGTTLPG